ncbi:MULTISPECIES: ABC transporter permease [unclassified Mesotoga]|jgi:ribose/xylose/arabinose/galactoside ABC-type transport system permease subunit|uniref:ABC transporter permease n=1 Tax=unclassified Mesotoga TaxID=1184398 RepID=UPI000EF1CC33|nr:MULTISPECIES: ABC transporter permease [unclassified Mesotoga]MDD2333696.1 ABC transporter permease [Mesotoga sp.]MDD3680990.1 ABC transporter permease [Mesotoga sp.]MDD4207726.1 ABC transporter permease [Mesotoga sp.]MDD4825428.1 ABC transporter permease [Mesotoga sp.]MDD5682812.1 ABC transporter permease [Mesotoga sp.]
MNYKNLLKRSTANIELFVLLLAAVVLIVVFSILEPRFFSVNNFRILLETMSILGILSLGVNFLLIAGEMDISFTSVLELSAAVVAISSTAHMNTFVSIAFGVLAATAVGLINAFFAVKLKIPSFLVTLGTQVAIGGLVMILCDYRTIIIRDKSFINMFFGRPFANIASAVYWMIGIAIVIWFVLTRTRFGKWVYATGGNQSSARLMGIPTDRVKISLFVTSAILAGIAGFILGSRATSARPAMGTSYLMPAISAPILAGAALTGGQGSAFKTLLAAFVLTIITNGVTLIGLEPAYRDIFMGVILISALSVRYLQNMNRD